MKITQKTASHLMKKLNMDPKKVPVDQLYQGLKVELEHGTRNKKTDVTHNDLTKTAKIAWAHILERPDYYTMLKKVEHGKESKTKQSKK